MRYPSPEDPGRAPIWENYVIAQVVQASLGLIPEHALAVGVEVRGAHVQLRFQLSEVTAGDEEDIADIVSELEALLGPDVTIGTTCRVVQEREISPSGVVSWTFLARSPDFLE